MFALVESGSITQMPKGNKGIQIGDVKYPAAIYTLWSEAERNAIGIYTVEIDNTNKKDEEWYINTNITYAFSGGKVKGTYGTATAKKIADLTYTSQDKTDGLIPSDKDVGDVAVAKKANVGDIKDYKSVKYSILYMKAIKALQESMSRIETLEAEVAALKST